MFHSLEAECENERSNSADHDLCIDKRIAPCIATIVQQRQNISSTEQFLYVLWYVG